MPLFDRMGRFYGESDAREMIRMSHGFGGGAGSGFFTGLSARLGMTGLYLSARFGIANVYFGPARNYIPCRLVLRHFYGFKKEFPSLSMFCFAAGGVRVL